MVPIVIIAAALAAPAQLSPTPLAMAGPEFHGTMVLELTLKGLDKLKSEESLEIDQFGGAICDDTSFGIVKVTKLLRKHGELTRLRMEFLINVRPSFDRAVSLYLTLMDGDSAISTASIESIKAAEKRGTWGRVDWDFKSAELAQLFGAGRVPTLKVLMRVVNNE